MSDHLPPARGRSAGDGPLFSIVWWGRNRLASAKETIAALQAQTCGDFELVVEDYGSTDGTLEAFRAAAAQDPRIRIFEQTTTRSENALLSVLRRCTGTYVAVCPCEGYFLPNAIEFAADKFKQLPKVGAICTSGFLIDAYGGQCARVDIISLFLTSYWPFLSAGFFRRQALLAVGLESDNWFVESLPLDLSYRLAADWGMDFFAENVLNCKNPRQQIDGLMNDVEGAIDDRLALVDRAFSRRGFFGHGMKCLALESKACQLGILREQVRWLQQPEVEYFIVYPLLSVSWSLYELLQIDHRVLRTLHRLVCVRGHNLGLLDAPLQKVLARTNRMTGRLPIRIGYSIWNAPFIGLRLIIKIIQLTLPAPRFHPSAPSPELMYADLYAVAGHVYEARGQIDLALEMWDHARPPDDVVLDSVACQAMLKSPLATDATLAQHQLAWARRHLGSRPAVSLPRRTSPNEKIRIGYHCAFMNSDTIRNMMRNVLVAHDRSKFEIFGYQPLSSPADIESAFDVVKHTPGDWTDRQFAECVRADGIDVFVELTGFSPGNRFDAMSLRCAPVQVSYLNHTGTSQVPNVDYVLSDEICTPASSDTQQFYSERIYRLPGCFFCFDYTGTDDPPVAPSPHLATGHITFGCFGSGGKIGSELIDNWAVLLKRVPEAKLHIQNAQLSSPDNRRFMEARFGAAGISPDRLVLEGGVDRATLVKAYSRIDISLDTWPYCGGNTIAESLWHGVPVVTLRGPRFSSAYGASLVTAAGCADLIGESTQDYIDIAANLAEDSGRLVRMRQNLRQMTFEYGLSDSKLAARRLEGAYVDMISQANCGTDQTQA